MTSESIELATSKRAFFIFCRVRIKPGAELSDLAGLQETFNRVRNHPYMLPEYANKISAHLTLLEKFVKYPYSLCAENGNSARVH